MDKTQHTQTIIIMTCLKKIQNTEVFGAKFSFRTLTTAGDTVLARDSVTGKAVTINVNAQMLITMLNSASPSELSTIKSILGIV